jgi:hypothetical protein
LTLDKGLKPLCRDYGLSTSGSKAAVVRRLMEHERDHKGAAASSQAVRAAAPAASSELVQAIRGLMGEPDAAGARLLSRVEVGEYLKRFAETARRPGAAQRPVEPLTRAAAVAG